jgi:CSLREA domain-containing protein
MSLRLFLWSPSQRRKPSRLLRIILLLAITALGAASARANEFVVTAHDDHDDGTCNADCSLREAIFAANQNPGPDSIRIAFSGFIDLADALPALGGNIQIFGNGSTVRRNGGMPTGPSYSVFTVSTGATVVLNDLILTNGGDTSIDGGAVHNRGTLTIDNCDLSVNTGNNGGGIFNDTTGTLTINNSTVSNNFGGLGGGIFNEGTLIVNNSTFNGNTAGNYGGAIFNDKAVTLTNSTLSDNEAEGGGGALSDNNGDNETFVINHCTIAHNRSFSGGGGLNFHNSTSAILSNTILAGNNSNGELFNYMGPALTSHGYNLSDDNPLGLTAATHDQINNSAINLDQLTDNGGPTQTIGLLNGSSAINAGDPAFDPNNFTPPLTTDQRGFPRVNGGRIDVGAFEVDMPQTGAFFTVNTAEDTDDEVCSEANCSLREAINAAMEPSGSDTIRIPFTTPITLDGALPDLDNVVIQGTSPDGPATVDAIGMTRHFVVTNGATVTLSRLRLINGIGDFGGSISNHGTLTLDSCTLSANAGTSGGAIFNGNTLTVSNSTINGNSTANFGGAIFNAGTVTLNNSTLTDNEAAKGGGALAVNGGVETFVVSNCTIAGNRSQTAGSGGGLDFFGTTSATLSNTILAGNTANGALSNYGSSNTPPPLISNGYNLSDDAPSGLTGTGDLVNNANVNLGTLADNGGPTQTMALLIGSAAINTGDPAFSPPPSTDQRGSGFPRVQGSRIDIGAFEATHVTQSGPNYVINVTSDGDDGACTDLNCSLREAINAANAHAGAEAINIPFTNPITLGGALPDLNGNLTVQGTNANGLATVDGAGLSRHFSVVVGNTVTFSRLRLINGHEFNNGGSIRNYGSLTLVTCALSGNTTAGYGGAIENNGGLRIINSTLNGNTAAGYGGAIFNEKSVTLINSTLTDNEAGTATSGGGGALSDNAGKETFVISNCTIAGNRTLTAGGGGGLDCINSTNVRLSNTILAGNTAKGAISNYSSNVAAQPPLISGGYNLSNDAPQGLTGTGDQMNKANINLGSLANNGGLTQTMALLSGSAAINGGDPNFAGSSGTDERGVNFPRLQGGRIDIGAFESAFSPGPISFDSTIYKVSEDAGTLTFNLVRTPGSTGAASVVCSTVDGTAKAGSDYTAKTATIHFGTTETAKTFTVAITNDNLNEINETFDVALSDPEGGATLGTPASKTVTILGNDTPPSVSINNVTVAEGNTGTVDATFAVTLSQASGKTVTVHYATSDGTATAGSDYAATSGTLAFAAGETSKSINVIVKGDTSHEANETFNVTLSSAVNATLGSSEGVGTITDDDAASGFAANVSTRLSVGTGDNLLIEGLIVQGPAGSTKKIVVRAIGPSLTSLGVANAIANPILEIFDSNNVKIASNDDWKTTQVGGIITTDQSAEISGSGLAPGNDLEAAIIATLAPGNYTAVVRGSGNGGGTAVVDAYDISPNSTAQLANVATRGLVQPGDNLLISGFIVKSAPVKVVVRAIGPSLAAFGIDNALPDTTLQLRDQNGVVVRENDDWMSDQKTELESLGLQPSNNLEAALVETIPPGQYTAQVRGKPETTGTGVVEVYFLP